MPFCHLLGPAEPPADAGNAVSRNRFHISRSSQHDAAFRLTASNGFCCRPDKKWVITWLLGICSKVQNLMAHLREHCFNLLFIAKPGVVRADRDLHRPNSSMMIGSDQRFFRSSGVQEFRSSGVQEFRSSGVQEFSVGRGTKLQGEKADLNMKS